MFEKQGFEGILAFCYFFADIVVDKGNRVLYLNKDDQEFRAIMENAFGQENIQKVWKNQYIDRPAITIIQERAGKSWGKA